MLPRLRFDMGCNAVSLAVWDSDELILDSMKSKSVPASQVFFVLFVSFC
jgi:hypothetical protein